MNVSSELWLIAGPNGAGKTTLSQRGPFAKNLEECVFLNADDQTLQQIRQLGFEGFQDVPTEVLEANFRTAAKIGIGRFSSRRATKDGLHFTTDKRSRKSQTLLLTWKPRSEP